MDEGEESANLLTAEEFERLRRWKLLLIIGVCLNAMVVFNSDLGLDTHIHLTYATVEGEQGEAFLEWGHTRPIDPMSSDPAYSPIKEDGWFNFIGDSTTDVRLFSFAVTLGFIGILYKQGRLELAVIAALYPAFIFSTGRGYPEVFIAVMLYSVAILISRACMEENANKMRWLSFAIAAPMAAVVSSKGIHMMWGLPFGIGAMAWFELAHQKPAIREQISRPLSVIRFVVVGVAMTMLLLGIFGLGSTLSVIADAPARFVSAIMFSILDVVIIYTLFGMVLWPFVGSAIKGLREAVDLETATLAGMIAAFTTAITIYVAALWTHESLLWNADWPWMILKMGNNGRYISLMIVPIFMLLKRMNDIGLDVPCLENPKEKYKALMIGIILVMPLSILAAVHGQTMWTDDAAEILDKNMEDSEEFLFIHETTLGMHYLYLIEYY